MGSAGYLSTASLTDLVSTPFLDTTLQSTIDGLGSAGYLSTVATSYVCQGRLAGDQSITPATDNIITFISDFDPQNWYNALTYRFTPNIAGYYFMSLGVWWSAGSSEDQDNVQMRKNGDTFMILQTPIPTVSGMSVSGSKLIYLNGVTDYVEFTAFSGNATAQSLQYATAAGAGTWFSAYLV